MYFYFKCVCFSWFLSYVGYATDNTSIPKCPANKFSLVNLGHSSILVKWNPEQIGRAKEMIFTWYPYPNEISSTSNKLSYYADYGQFKISSLKENTNYRIKIGIRTGTKFYKRNDDECWIARKPIVKTNFSLLTKPDFEFFLIQTKLPDGVQFRYQPIVRIEWLPCGRKGYCEGEEIAGSHFSVKYKMLESRQMWKTYEYDRSTKFIFGLLPGRTYEIIVTSIVTVENVDIEIESDSQEVFIMPGCSPVRNVKIVTLSNSSFLISWRLPKYCLQKDPILGYTVFYSIFDNNTTVFLNYSYYECPYEVTKTYSKKKTDSRFIVEQKIITKLITGARYLFFIIPYYVTEKSNVYGLEYRIDHTVLYTSELRLPLAKPEFLYEVSSTNGFCYMIIFWYPCGRTFDCTTTRPGSHFLVTYRKLKDGLEQKYNETNREGCSIDLDPQQKYEVKVQSGDEYGYSVFSDEKIIDTSKCSGPLDMTNDEE